MNKKLKLTSLFVLLAVLVVSVVCGVIFMIKPTTNTVAAAYVHNVRYGNDGVKDYNVNHWTAQGNRVTGETSGKWYFGHGNISTGSVSFTEGVATANSDTNSTGTDFIGGEINGVNYTHHRFTYGYRLRAARYGATSNLSLIKWVAETDGYVKFTGVIAKALASDNSSLVEGYDPKNGNPWMNVDWSIGKWYDGASFTIGMWKANSYNASQVMLIDEVTYTSAFAYQVNPTGANIAVRAGDAIYFSYKCNANATNYDDWYNDSFCLLSSEFKSYTNTASYSGDDFVDITSSGTFTDKMANGQGTRTTGETSGCWNFTMGNVDSTGYTKLQDLVHNTDASYETINGTAQNPSNTGDTKRFTSGGYSNMILWGDEVVVNTRYATMFEWTAEASGNVRFGGLVSKGHSDKGGLIAMTPGQESIKYYATNPAQNATDYSWRIGDSYTVGIYKISDSTVTVLSEKTFTSEYAYLIPSDSIAVSAGERIVFALKANTTLGGDYSTGTIMMINSKFTQDLDLGMSITKNMILQQKKKANIWGTGAPGRTVTVSIDSQVKTTTIDNNGDWLVQLDPMTASEVDPTTGAFVKKTMTITDGFTTKTLEGILVGEVWMTSGQSNMAYSFKELLVDRGYDADNMTAAEIYATPMFSDWAQYEDNYSNVRIFTPGYAQKASPDKVGTDAYWVNEEYGWGGGGDIKGWFGHSVYGLGFALRLQQKLGVPVGFINVAVGGSSIEEWLSNETITNNGYTLVYDQSAKPASQLYNGMMYPVKNATVNGFMWYQGCADSQSANGATMADMWAQKMVGFVAQVRSEHGNIPFVSQSLVQMYGWQPFQYMRQLNWNLQSQISNFYAVNGIAAGYAYDEVRPTNTTDNDIHPADKYGISRDAANIALNYVYGYQDCMGTAAYPTVAYKQGSNVIVDYGAMEKDSSNTLVLTSGTTVNNLSISKNGDWVECTNATLKDNKIIIPNPDNDIVAVAYGYYGIMAEDAFTSTRVTHGDSTNPTAYDVWYNDEPVNLFSANGVAAAPFQYVGVSSTEYQTGASVSVDEDFTMNYQFILKSGYSNPKVYFSYRTRTAVVSATLNADGLTYKASFDSIAPQDLTSGVTIDKIEATDSLGRTVNLTLNWDKETDFSIQDYLVELKGIDTSAKTQTLIVNVLNYGAAAQTFLKYETSNLANAVLSSSDQSYATTFDATVAASKAVRALSGTASSVAGFAGANIHFDTTLGIGVYIHVDASILANATIKVTNTEGFEDTVAISSLEKESGYYFYMVDGLNPGADCEMVYTFQILNNGVAEGKQLQYNVYGYINSKGSSGDALAQALYSYVQAVSAFNA